MYKNPQILLSIEPCVFSIDFLSSVVRSSRAFTEPILSLLDFSEQSQKHLNRLTPTFKRKCSDLRMLLNEIFSAAETFVIRFGTLALLVILVYRLIRKEI